MADSTHFSFSESEFQKAKAKSNCCFWRKPPPWNKKWGVKEEQGRKEKQMHEGKSLLRTTDGSALLCGSWKSGVFSLRFLDGGKRKFDFSLSSFIGWRVGGSSRLFLDRPHLALSNMVNWGGSEESHSVRGELSKVRGREWHSAVTAAQECPVC